MQTQWISFDFASSDDKGAVFMVTRDPFSGEYKYIPAQEGGPKFYISGDSLVQVSDATIEWLTNINSGSFKFSPAEPATERKRAPLAYFTEKPKFDPWKGFFTEPADIADWQDTYFPR